MEPVNQQLHHILGHRQELDGSQLPGPSFFLRGVTDQILLGEYGQELTHKEGITAGFSLQEPLPAGVASSGRQWQVWTSSCEM